MGEAGWRCVGEVGSWGGRRAWGVPGACLGRAWGVGGACAGPVLDVGGGVRGVCLGRAWGVRGACVGAISVGIARSALLSGYLGKSGHLPRCRGHGIFFNKMYPNLTVKREGGSTSLLHALALTFYSLNCSLDPSFIVTNMRNVQAILALFKCEVASTH